jgi:hypothetical protein
MLVKFQVIERRYSELHFKLGARLILGRSLSRVASRWSAARTEVAVVRLVLHSGYIRGNYSPSTKC